MHHANQLTQQTSLSKAEHTLSNSGRLGWRDEMVQQLRAPTALLKDLGLIPSSRMVAHNGP